MENKTNYPTITLLKCIRNLSDGTPKTVDEISSELANNMGDFGSSMNYSIFEAIRVQLVRDKLYPELLEFIKTNWPLNPDITAIIEKNLSNH